MGNKIPDEADVLKENAALKEQVTKLTADNEAFAKLLDESNKLAIARQDEIASLTAKNKENETAISALTETVKSKDSEISSLKTENTDLRAKEQDIDKRAAEKVAQLGIRPAPVKITVTDAKKDERKQLSKLEEAIEIQAAKYSE